MTRDPKIVKKILPDKTIIIGEVDTFTRKTLLLAVANTDGGAHIGRSLNLDYHKLKHEFQLLINFPNDKAEEFYIQKHLSLQDLVSDRSHMRC